MAFQQGDVYNFNLANSPREPRAPCPGAPPGSPSPGDPGFPGKSGINSQYGHFDPRIGFAWDPFGDGKTAIRVGAGIGHDFIEQDLHLNTSSSLPFRLTVIQPGVVNLDNPYPQGDPFPYNYNPKNPVWPSLVRGSLPGEHMSAEFPSRFRRTCTTHVQYSWNLGVQRQISQNWFVSATYVGTHILHVWNAVELNPADIYPWELRGGAVWPDGGAVTARLARSATYHARRVLNLANPTAHPLGYLTQYDDGGTQGYNGLLLSTTYRLRSGLT